MANKTQSQTKTFLIVGGFLGFTITLISSLYAGNQISAGLLDASIGCVVGTMLMKFVAKQFCASVRDSVQQKSKAMQQADDNEEESNPNHI